MLQSPCYDPVTQTHCTKRYPGCSGDCPDWDDYVEIRDKEYENRRKRSASSRAFWELKNNIKKNRDRKHSSRVHRGVRKFTDDV